MKAAIFGGSFNPVHIGHLIMAEEVLHATHCDKVIFMPAFLPPHKDLEDPGPDFRASMLEAGIADAGIFALNRCELDRRGLSYTIDSLRYLKSQGIVDEKPCIILGDDLIDGFSAWKEAEALSREAELVVVRRKSPIPLAFSYPHRYLANRMLPISSSEIRSLIQAKGPWRYLVPPGTRTIIEANGLYGYTPDRN